MNVGHSAVTLWFGRGVLTGPTDLPIAISGMGTVYILCWPEILPHLLFWTGVWELLILLFSPSQTPRSLQDKVYSRWWRSPLSFTASLRGAMTEETESIFFTSKRFFPSHRVLPHQTMVSPHLPVPWFSYRWFFYFNQIISQQKSLTKFVSPTQVYTLLEYPNNFFRFISPHKISISMTESSSFSP